MSNTLILKLIVLGYRQIKVILLERPQHNSNPNHLILGLLDIYRKRVHVFLLVSYRYAAMSCSSITPFD
jgi:hypothetical protein